MRMYVQFVSVPNKDKNESFQFKNGVNFQQKDWNDQVNSTAV